MIGTVQCIGFCVSEHKPAHVDIGSEARGGLSTAVVDGCGLMDPKIVNEWKLNL